MRLIFKVLSVWNDTITSRAFLHTVAATEVVKWYFPCDPLKIEVFPRKLSPLGPVFNFQF